MKVHKLALRKVIHGGIIGILCICIVVLGASYRVLAEGKAAILQSVLKDENICLFISGLDKYESITGQIGRETIEIVNTDADISGHTIIMIDNSLSVTKTNLEKSKKILEQYVENKAEKEKISLAIYGTDIQYLVEKETDGVKIIDALESVVSEDKDTYLTDVLYDELQKLERNEEYTRFILVTDGVDNKAIGYTKDELSEYLKKDSYPIYSLGCKYKDNDEQLKSLFAISRFTNAGYYLLDDYEEYDEIVNGLSETITCVEIKVPDEFRDGSVKNILLTFKGEDGTIEISDELSMPFQVKKEKVEPIEETKIEEAPEIEEISENESSEPISEVAEEVVQEDVSGESSVDLISVGAVIVIIIALIIFVIINIKNKNKKMGKSKDKNSSKSKPIEPSLGEDEQTVVLNAAMSVEDAPQTEMLFDRGRVRYIVVLKDNNDAGKVFRYPLFDRVLIGRKYENGVNIVLNYEPTVSAKHCEIGMRGNTFYVKDFHSSNKTFLNGREVGDYMEFSSGDNIKMGNLDMTIEIERTMQ